MDRVMFSGELNMQRNEKQGILGPLRYRGNLQEDALTAQESCRYVV